MNYEDLSQFVFDFMDEYFIHEADGMRYLTSEEDAQERLEMCSKCVHFIVEDEQPVCRSCGCLLEAKTRDPFASCPMNVWETNSREWNSNTYEYVLGRLRKRLKKYESN